MLSCDPSVHSLSEASVQLRSAQIIATLSLITPQGGAHLDEPETHPLWIPSAEAEERVSRGVGWFLPDRNLPRWRRGVSDEC